MKIQEVNCFAVKNDGTLLIKTELDEPKAEYRYCFYIYKGSECLYKSPYDRRSFLMYQVNAFGKYQIKAFVRNGDGTEKETCVISYILNKANASELTEDEPNGELPAISVSVETLKNGALLATAEGDLSEGVQFAWYIYPAGEKEPEFKSAYSSNPMMIYRTKVSGMYFAKLFVKVGGKKYSINSEEIAV